MIIIFLQRYYNYQNQYPLFFFLFLNTGGSKSL